MADFNSIEAFYANLEKQVIQSLEQEAIKIQQAIRLYILTNIYNSYTPSVYNRTQELLNSAIIKPVQNKGGEYYIEIYISDEMHSQSNWVGESRTLSEIAEAFANGEGYSRGGIEYDAIGNIQEEYVASGRAINEILGMLKSKGFDIS